MKREPLQAFVDRIEEKSAVLLIGENNPPIIIPVALLPENVEEGTVVKLRFEVDSEATIEAKEKAAGLIERLRRRGV